MHCIIQQVFEELENRQTSLDSFDDYVNFRSSFDDILHTRKFKSKYTLENHTFCECCQQSFDSDMMCIDHIIPLFVFQYMHLPIDANDVTNLQCICSNCHAKKSKEEKLYFKQNLWKPYTNNNFVRNYFDEESVYCLDSFQKFNKCDIRYTCYGAPYKINDQFTRSFNCDPITANELNHIL